MKRIGIISTTAALFLVLGITAPAGAQKGQDDKQDQPAKQQQGRGKQQGQGRQQQQQQQRHIQQSQQGRARQQHAQQSQQGQGRQQQQHIQQQHVQQPQQGQARQQHAQQERQQANRPSQHGQRVPRAAQPAVWQQHRARSWEAEHRTWQQRGGYNGYRIPADRFRGYFGPGHGFRIYSYPVYVVGGFPRFHYGGFWFSLVDPWPEYWAHNWYQTDDVYIDYYEDGYYLYNRRHPGVRIAINVVLG
jgi:hypothetical protein